MMATRTVLSLLVPVSLLALLIGAMTFFQLTWVLPAREGNVTQNSIVTSLGNERIEKLRLRVLFYMNSVSLDGETLTEAELREVCRISSNNKTLKYVEISNSSLRQDLFDGLKDQFGLEVVVVQ